VTRANIKVRLAGNRVTAVDTRRILPPAKAADDVLLTAEHRRFREIVCERAGWRCEWTEAGQRCTRSRANGDRMVADHIVERADGGDPFDPDNGQCLCIAHNTRKGIVARMLR
jgi:hypothetical protein